MVYRMLLFPMTFSDPNLNFKVTVTVGLDALDVLCAQLTRDLFAIAKFLSFAMGMI